MKDCLKMGKLVAGRLIKTILMVQAMNNEILIDGSVMERRDWYGSHLI